MAQTLSHRRPASVASSSTGPDGAPARGGRSRVGGTGAASMTPAPARARSGLRGASWLRRLPPPFPLQSPVESSRGVPTAGEGCRRPGRSCLPRLSPACCISPHPLCRQPRGGRARMRLPSVCSAASGMGIKLGRCGRRKRRQLSRPRQPTPPRSLSLTSSPRHRWRPLPIHSLPCSCCSLWEPGAPPSVPYTLAVPHLRHAQGPYLAFLCSPSPLPSPLFPLPAGA